VEASLQNRPQSYRGRANSLGTARVARRRNLAPKPPRLTVRLTVVAPFALPSPSLPPQLQIRPPDPRVRTPPSLVMAARSNSAGSTSGSLASRSSEKFQASACAHSCSRHSTACGSPIWSLSRTTNLCRRRTHCPRIVSGSHEVRTTTGMAVGNWARRPARTPLNPSQSVRRRKLVFCGY